MEKVIEIHNLVKIYPKKGKSKDGVTAVGGISFAVQKGEIFGLLGAHTQINHFPLKAAFWLRQTRIFTNR